MQFIVQSQWNKTIQVTVASLKHNNFILIVMIDQLENGFCIGIFLVDVSVYILFSFVPILLSETFEHCNFFGFGLIQEPHRTLASTFQMNCDKIVFVEVNSGRFVLFFIEVQQFTSILQCVLFLYLWALILIR